MSTVNCSISPVRLYIYIYQIYISVFDDSTVWRFDYRNYGKKRDVNGHAKKDTISKSQNADIKANLKGTANLHKESIKRTCTKVFNQILKACT